MPCGGAGVVRVLGELGSYLEQEADGRVGYVVNILSTEKRFEGFRLWQEQYVRWSVVVPERLSQAYQLGLLLPEQFVVHQE